MMQAYAPFVVFHPDEQYFPSSVWWFFRNGVELHEIGRIFQYVINNGDNLPNNGGPYDAFLDLPSSQPYNKMVKNGFLPSACAYVHAKLALGGTCTDLAIWLYYPFNGGGKVQLGSFIISLGKIGEHVSDWEHITSRIDNFSGILKAIYLSRHNKGTWLTPGEFEAVDGTRPMVYASVHGHAHYSTPTSHLHLVGNLDPSDIQMLYDAVKTMNDSRESLIAEEEIFLGFGVRDDVVRSNNVMDVASAYDIVSIGYFDVSMYPWLNYTGRRGPKITYDFTEEVPKAINTFPHILKKLARKILYKLSGYDDSLRLLPTVAYGLHRRLR